LVFHVTIAAIQNHASDNIEFLNFQECDPDTDAEAVFKAYGVSRLLILISCFKKVVW